MAGPPAVLWSHLHSELLFFASANSFVFLLLFLFSLCWNFTRVSGARESWLVAKQKLPAISCSKAWKVSSERSKTHVRFANSFLARPVPPIDVCVCIWGIQGMGVRHHSQSSRKALLLVVTMVEDMIPFPLLMTMQRAGKAAVTEDPPPCFLVTLLQDIWQFLVWTQAGDPSFTVIGVLTMVH